MQTADAEGRKFEFNAQEKRDNSKMSFLRQSYNTAKKGEYGASMQKANAIGDIASSIGGLADSVGSGFTDVDGNLTKSFNVEKALTN